MTLDSVANENTFINLTEKFWCAFLNPSVAGRAKQVAVKVSCGRTFPPVLLAHHVFMSASVGLNNY